MKPSCSWATRRRRGGAFEDAVAAGSADSDAYVVSESQLGLLAMDRGDWADASSHVQRALAVIDEHRMGDYSTSVLAFAGGGAAGGAPG